MQWIRVRLVFHCEVDFGPEAVKEILLRQIEVHGVPGDVRDGEANAGGPVLELDRRATPDGGVTPRVAMRWRGDGERNRRKACGDGLIVCREGDIDTADCIASVWTCRHDGHRVDCVHRRCDNHGEQISHLRRCSCLSDALST